MTTDVVVVGAGVIGLTTGVVLTEAGAAVRIVSAEEPAATTSAVAGALTGIVPPGPLPALERWGSVTTAALTSLAGDPTTGVRLTSGTALSTVGGELPPTFTALPEFTPVPASSLDGKYQAGFRARVPVVEMLPYLRYLLARFEAAGGVLELRRVPSLAAVAGSPPVVVNCAGVGARALAGDPTVGPMWGQHVVVDNPGVTEFFVEHTADPAWASFMPHGDHVVLGGVAVPDRWDRAPDPDVAAGILARCAAVEPRLAGARVREHRVGLRPSRPSVRLDLEVLDGARCVHCYGHGGMGVSLSWGCAREIAALVTG